VLKIGKPRELVYNAKVDNYNFGIVAGSGLNSIAAIKENGINIDVKSEETVMPIEDMDLIFEQ
jgi:repressor of nif and glnA expression